MLLSDDEIHALYDWFRKYLLFLFYVGGLGDFFKVIFFTFLAESYRSHWNER